MTGCRILTGLKTLRTLDLSETKISSAGLEYVAELTGLRVLYLKKTQRHGRRLSIPEGPAGAGRVHLEGTRVTRAGFTYLKSALPNTQIFKSAVDRLCAAPTATCRCRRWHKGVRSLCFPWHFARQAAARVAWATPRQTTRDISRRLVPCGYQKPQSADELISSVFERPGNQAQVSHTPS